MHKRFDPTSPMVEPAHRADRPRSPAEDVVKLLNAPFESTRVIMTGTTGSGKSTELLRIGERCSQQYFVVHLDLQQHFFTVMGDEQALQNVSSWEVVFLAGVAVVKAASELLPYPVPSDLLDDLGKAWSAMAKATGTPTIEPQLDIGALAKAMVVLGSSAAPLAGASPEAEAGIAAGLKLLDAATGALKWLLPIGRTSKNLPDQDRDVQTMLSAVNSIIGFVQTHMRPLLLIIDGLDRIVDLGRAKELFLHSELIAQLVSRLVVAGPFALHSHLSRGSIRRFSENRVLYNEPVMQKGNEGQPGPGTPFFCEIFKRRIQDLPRARDILSNEQLDRLAYYSGGRARDFVRTIRSLAEQGWIHDAAEATPALVDKVIDEQRRLLEGGLDAGHIEVLESVVADPLRRLPKGEVARELLDYGKLLPYPNESEWYYPHPLLMMHLVRRPPIGSRG